MGIGYSVFVPSDGSAHSVTGHEVVEP